MKCEHGHESPPWYIHLSGWAIVTNLFFFVVGLWASCGYSYTGHYGCRALEIKRWVFVIPGYYAAGYLAEFMDERVGK